MRIGTTLTRYIIRNQREIEGASGVFTGLLNDICVACKKISDLVNKGALVNVLGSAQSENVQGEEQKKLDIISNEVMIEALEHNGHLAALASEEMEGIYPMKGALRGRYLLLCDPLDGSSNIDVNVSVGTIFSIYRRVSAEGTPVTKEDFLQKGKFQVAAGYVIYGSSTMLVYTTGNGVNGFTLDPAIGTFYLSHPNMKIAEDGAIYSINEGNYNQLEENVRNYIEYCRSGETKKSYTARYIGSLVADVHRNILKGGIYMYPGTTKNPNGKLRLLYECNPLAFVIEQAGGKATDGKNNILDIEPTELHQRVPFYAGSKNMVDKLHEMLVL